MSQQKTTTTSGTGKPPGHHIGKEVLLRPDAKKKDLGNNKLEIQQDGETFTAHLAPNGRVIRDS